MSGELQLGLLAAALTVRGDRILRIAEDLVDTRSARDRVLPAEAGADHVVAGAAVQGVLTLVASQHVVAVAAVEVVITVVALQQVVTVAADQLIVERATVDRVVAVAAVEEVVALVGGAAVAPQHVVAADAEQAV